MTDTTPALPAQTGGYEVTRFNALRHGVLSRLTVLPWEDEAEYRQLLETLTQEHQPEGPTEEHLVEELAGIFWRKRRLRQAESAIIRNALRSELAHRRQDASEAADAGGALPMPASLIASERAELLKDKQRAERALTVLQRGDDEGTYLQALRALGADLRANWKEWLEDEAEEDEAEEDEAESYQPTASSLRAWIRDGIIPYLDQSEAKLQSPPGLRDQLLGAACTPQGPRWESLARHEVHLDRKLERTLGMLLKLKELRRMPEPS